MEMKHGVCSQCQSKVHGSHGHEMDCSYAVMLYCAEHPEVDLSGEEYTKRIHKRAQDEKWIVGEEEDV